jgi:hypothetical protein
MAFFATNLEDEGFCFRMGKISATVCPRGSVGVKVNDDIGHYF